MNTMNFSESYTYRPGQVPPKEDWSASVSYQRAEAMHQTAERTADFFQRSDNGEFDVDPREGYVRLKNAPAPELLERTTTTVTGLRTPDGDLQVTGENSDAAHQANYAPTTLAIHGQEVIMDRPVYLNDRYMSTIESLKDNPDGTRTFSMSYYQ
jgi:hypothetical protein